VINLLIVVIMLFFDTYFVVPLLHGLKLECIGTGRVSSIKRWTFSI